MLRERLVCKYKSNQERHCPCLHNTDILWGDGQKKKKNQQTKLLQILKNTMKGIAEWDKIYFRYSNEERSPKRGSFS